MHHLSYNNWDLISYCKKDDAYIEKTQNTFFNASGQQKKEKKTQYYTNKIFSSLA